MKNLESSTNWISKELYDWYIKPQINNWKSFKNSHAEFSKYIETPWMWMYKMNNHAKILGIIPIIIGSFVYLIGLMVSLFFGLLVSILAPLFATFFICLLSCAFIIAWVIFCNPLSVKLINGLIERGPKWKAKLKQWVFKND